MKELFRDAILGSAWTRASFVTLCTVVALALAVPAVSPWALDDVDWDAIDQAPGAAHWFGTDGAGRDLLTRTWAGGRVSIAIAVLATAVSVLIGVPYGAAAGLLGGRVDQAMMRVVDALYALPFVLFVILLVVVFGRNPYLLCIVLRHVLPNVSGPALVYATLTIPGVILAESFISFLGLGIQEPDASWGVLISDGARAMQTSWWQLVFPAGVLALTLLSCNVLGDRLRDALDRRDTVSPGTTVAADGAPSGS